VQYDIYIIVHGSLLEWVGATWLNYLSLAYFNFFS